MHRTDRDPATLYKDNQVRPRKGPDDDEFSTFVYLKLKDADEQKKCFVAVNACWKRWGETLADGL